MRNDEAILMIKHTEGIQLISCQRSGQWQWFRFVSFRLFVQFGTLRSLIWKLAFIRFQIRIASVIATAAAII